MPECVLGYRDCFKGFRPAAEEAERLPQLSCMHPEFTSCAWLICIQQFAHHASLTFSSLHIAAASLMKTLTTSSLALSHAPHTTQARLIAHGARMTLKQAYCPQPPFSLQSRCNNLRCSAAVTLPATMLVALQLSLVASPTHTSACSHHWNRCSWCHSIHSEYGLESSEYGLDRGCYARYATAAWATLEVWERTEC